MAQITKVRLPDGRTLTPGDWTSAEPLYSTIEIAAGTYTTLQAFSYALGGDVPGSVGPRKSNLTDTNLQGQGAQLPENEEIIVYAMMIEGFTVNQKDLADYDGLPPQTLLMNPPDLPHVSVQDMLALQRDLVIVARIASVKEYTRAPLGWFPQAMGVFPTYQQVTSSVLGGVTETTKGVDGFVTGNNGSVDAGGKRVFASPLYVEGGESLSVDFLAPSGQVEGLSFATPAQGELAGRIRLRTYLDGYRRRPVA
jgi:hypothetical protein